MFSAFPGSAEQRSCVLGHSYAAVVRSLPASTVAEISGLTLRQLRYLATSEVLIPSVRLSAGAGSESLYGPGDVLPLLAVAKVRSICGPEVRVERLLPITQVLTSRTAGPQQLLVSDPEGCWITSADRLPAALRRSVCAIVIDLDALEDDLQARLDRAGIASTPLASAI